MRSHPSPDSSLSRDGEWPQGGHERSGLRRPGPRIQGHASVGDQDSRLPGYTPLPEGSAPLPLQEEAQGHLATGCLRFPWGYIHCRIPAASFPGSSSVRMRALPLTASIQKQATGRPAALLGPILHFFVPPWKEAGIGVQVPALAQARPPLLSLSFLIREPELSLSAPTECPQKLDRTTVVDRRRDLSDCSQSRLTIGIHMLPFPIKGRCMVTPFSQSLSKQKECRPVLPTWGTVVTFHTALREPQCPISIH